MTHESDRLDDQRPCSHEFADHESAEDGLDLGYTAVAGVRGVGGYQKAGRHGEDNLRRKCEKEKTPTACN